MVNALLNHVGTQPIETTRLILRQHRLTDAEDMFNNWVTDPQVSKFWSWEPHKNIEETKSLLSKWINEYSDSKTYHWIIELKSISQAIGYIYLKNEVEANDAVSVHFALSRKYWNQGIMTEACKGVIDFAFSILGVQKVMSSHHVDNPASGRVQQKSSMRYVKTIHSQEPVCGDYCYYEITRDDWELKPKHFFTYPLA